MNVSSGEFLEKFPYARLGDGPEPLVVVPGVDDAMFSGRYPTPALAAMYWYFSPYLDDYTVYVVSRPRHLPDGHDIDDMADGYAAVLSDAIGPADVVGVSMGGMIAQSLAARYPDLVDRVVLANTGHRIADTDVVDRFLEYAEAHDWAAIRAELSAAMFSDWRQATYPPLALTLGRVVAPRPADPDDVGISLGAIRAFDGADRLGDVRSPAFVFGGTEDPYFPEATLRETADAIPDADLSLVRGGKHAAFHERKPAFDARVTSFLERPTAVPAAD